MNSKRFRYAVLALLAAAVLFAGSFVPVLAAGEDSADRTSYTLGKGSVENGSLVLKRYNSFSNAGSIKGNVVALTRSFDSKGEIEGNIVAFASNLNISGKVGKNIIGYYPNVNITKADIGRDVFIYTDSFTSDDKSVFESDINMYSKDVLIKGVVKGDIALVADSVTINAEVDGNVEVACNELVLGNDADIKGNVTYQSDVPLVKTDSTKVGGKIKQVDMKTPVPAASGEEEESGVLSSFMTYFNTLNKICALVIGLLFVKFLPISALKIDLFTRKNYMKCLVAGALASVLVFPVAFVFALTVVGLPLALHLLSIYFDLTFIALIPAALVIGGLFTKDRRLVNMMLMGTLVILILDYLPIPFVPAVLSMLVNMLGMGSIILLVSLFIRYHINKERKEFVTLESLNSAREDIMKTKQEFDRRMNERAQKRARRREEIMEEFAEAEEEEENPMDRFVDISEKAESDPEFYNKKEEETEEISEGETDDEE